jgi:hypothetical protein
MAQIYDETFRCSAADGAAREYARRIGAAGRSGGWIYNAHGLALCQGWAAWTRRCKATAAVAKVDGVWRVRDDEATEAAQEKWIREAAEKRAT